MAKEIGNVSNIPAVINGKHVDQQRTYQVVVIATKEMGLSKDGILPWNLPTDSKFFHEVTTKTSNPNKMNAVIMGRKSWDDISVYDRPHRGRLNIVLTRDSASFDVGDVGDDKENVLVCGSIEDSLKLLATQPYDESIETVFLIGGGEVLRQALKKPDTCDALHITEIETDFECDVFMPHVDTSLFHPWYASAPLVENDTRYSFVTYVRVRSVPDSDKFEVHDFSFLPQMIHERHEEFMYLRLVQDILSSGNLKGDGTGTSNLSKFGCQMKFNLRKSFPLLTTKRLCWQGIVEGLLLSISGSTYAKVQQERGPHRCEENASRSCLESHTDMNADYTGKRIELKHLSDVIHKIKNTPDDRHIILSSPSSHTVTQFYVAKGELSCTMYQPLADMGLGVPLDIASKALLTSMIAHVCDLRSGDFIYAMGDAHVYHNHIQPLLDQLQNFPRPFPVLTVNPRQKDINSFEASDFKLIGYCPHP